MNTHTRIWKVRKGCLQGYMHGYIHNTRLRSLIYLGVFQFSRCISCQQTFFFFVFYEFGKRSSKANERYNQWQKYLKHSTLFRVNWPACYPVPEIRLPPPPSKLLAIQDHAQNFEEQLWMESGGGRWALSNGHNFNNFATGCSVFWIENSGSTNSLQGAESGMVPLTYKVFS